MVFNVGAAQSRRGRLLRDGFLTGDRTLARDRAKDA